MNTSFVNWDILEQSSCICAVTERPQTDLTYTICNAGAFEHANPALLSTPAEIKESEYRTVMDQGGLVTHAHLRSPRCVLIRSFY